MCKYAHILHQADLTSPYALLHKTSPLNIIVGLNIFPLAEMMGMRVAVSVTSLCKANWCTCFAEPICQVLDVLLSRKQHVSSIEKM